MIALTDGGDSRDPMVQLILDRLRAERVRAVGVYRMVDSSAEELVRLVLPQGGFRAMRPDEYLDCLNRRSAYVACRAVETVDRDAAWRAGL